MSRFLDWTLTIAVLAGIAVLVIVAGRHW